MILFLFLYVKWCVLLVFPVRSPHVVRAKQHNILTHGLLTVT